MSKVMQEHYLVVYQQEKDFIEKLEYFISKAFEGKYLYKTKDRKIIVKTEYGDQQCYYFIKYHKGIDPYQIGLMGSRYSGVTFLGGEYESTFINLCLVRCRGGSWEVGEI